MFNLLKAVAISNMHSFGTRWLQQTNKDTMGRKAVCSRIPGSKAGLVVMMLFLCKGALVETMRGSWEVETRGKCQMVVRI